MQDYKTGHLIAAPRASDYAQLMAVPIAPGDALVYPLLRDTSASAATRAPVADIAALRGFGRILSQGADALPQGR